MLCSICWRTQSTVASTWLFCFVFYACFYLGTTITWVVADFRERFCCVSDGLFWLDWLSCARKHSSIFLIVLALSFSFFSSGSLHLPRCRRWLWHTRVLENPITLLEWCFLPYSTAVLYLRFCLTVIECREPFPVVCVFWLYCVGS